MLQFCGPALSVKPADGKVLARAGSYGDGTPPLPPKMRLEIINYNPGRAPSSRSLPIRPRRVSSSKYWWATYSRTAGRPSTGASVNSTRATRGPNSTTFAASTPSRHSNLGMSAPGKPRIVGLIAGIIESLPDGAAVTQGPVEPLGEDAGLLIADRPVGPDNTVDVPPDRLGLGQGEAGIQHHEPDVSSSDAEQILEAHPAHWSRSAVVVNEDELSLDFLPPELEPAGLRSARFVPTAMSTEVDDVGLVLHELAGQITRVRRGGGDQRQFPRPILGVSARWSASVIDRISSSIFRSLSGLAAKRRMRVLSMVRTPWREIDLLNGDTSRLLQRIGTSQVEVGRWGVRRTPRRKVDYSAFRRAGSLAVDTTGRRRFARSS